MTSGNMFCRKAEEDEESDVAGPAAIRALPYARFESVRQQRLITFYLSDMIGDPRYYTEMIHTFRTANEQDIISIHLNTGGGRLDTGIQIINAIKDSAARVVGVLDSKAYSLGTLIMLACDEFVIHDNCMFMIHNYSGGVVGKGNEQVSELQATIAWFTKLAKKYYIPFLTEDELKAVLKGEDMWMDSDEIKKRLRNMVKIQTEAATKARSKKEVVADGELPPAGEVQVPPGSTGKPKRAPRRRKTDPAATA